MCFYYLYPINVDLSCRTQLLRQVMPYNLVVL